MERRFKKDGGITLIALIITIIIMLILVAVSVNILIKSNLIGAAEKTANGYKTAYEKESNLKGIKVNGKDINSYIPLPEIKAGERASETSQYKTAVIPKGFTVSGISTEQNVENGLVIYDIPAEDSTKVDWENPDTVKTKYNQFVWIPVEVTEEDDETSVAAFRRSVWQDNERTENNEQSSTSFPRSSTSWSNFTEPYSYDDKNYDGEDGTGITAQIVELTKSIYKYGGFWIGRYEAGVKPEADGTETPRTNNSSSQTAEFVIQQDKYPYNYIKWGTSMGDVSTEGAVYLCNNMYTDYETYGVKSMLCTGAAWDSMLDFIKDANHSVTDSTTWGNYRFSETYQITRGKLSTTNGSTWTAANFSGSDVAKDSIILLTTGATERNSWRNLYDVAGNCFEWTTEAVNSNSRVFRGGYYFLDGSYHPASSRSSDYPVGASYVSFRPLLYINVN